MDPVTLTLVSGALAGSGFAQTRRLLARGTAWRRAAESCGLREIRVTRRLGVVTALRGRIGRLDVSIDSSVTIRMAGATRIRVHGIADVAMRAERDAETAMLKTLARLTEHEVGDPVFDDAVYLEGAPEVLQALLDTSTRQAVRRLMEGMLYGVEGGAVCTARARLQRGVDVRVGEGAAGFAQRSLPLALRLVLDLARRLELPEAVPQRLALNAREDALPEVRRRNLVLLVREFPDDPATASALREACADGDEENRLYAALQIGLDGHPVLRSLADGSQSDSCAARAIHGLGTDLSPGEALELLSGALPRRRLASAIACIEALGGRGGSATVAALERVLAIERGPVAAAAANALGSPGLPGAEAVLLERGLVHGDADTRVAAAAALGRVGTVAAVLPLRELPAGGQRARRAARQAVAAIQSRLPGAAPGQLSVSGLAGGAVSLATEGGEVSLDVPMESP